VGITQDTIFGEDHTEQTDWLLSRRTLGYEGDLKQFQVVTISISKISQYGHSKPVTRFFLYCRRSAGVDRNDSLIDEAFVERGKNPNRSG
jgi:hypothetical protein